MDQTPECYELVVSFSEPFASTSPSATPPLPLCHPLYYEYQSLWRKIFLSYMLLHIQNINRKVVSTLLVKHQGHCWLFRAQSTVQHTAVVALPCHFFKLIFCLLKLHYIHDHYYSPRESSLKWSSLCIIFRQSLLKFHRLKKNELV